MKMASTGVYKISTNVINTISDRPRNFNSVVYAVVLKATDEIIYQIYNAGQKLSYIGYQYGDNASIKWDEFITNSDLGSIDCEVNTIANNQIDIPNSPTEPNYIPIVKSHSDNNLVRENIYYVGGGWRIFSDYAQKTLVRFYKYPV